MTPELLAAHARQYVVSHLPARYGCGAVQFTGSENTYDRHLLLGCATSTESSDGRPGRVAGDRR